MTLQRVGGLAAFTCAATYIIGFMLLLTLLAPLGYGAAEIDAAAVAAFIDARPGILISWNSTIYIVNALALAVLVVALSNALKVMAPGWAAVLHGLGLIWATLVLGAGTIANVAVERTALIYPEDPVAAAHLWSVLHGVELGLGGGNEIAGGAWIAGVSAASVRVRALPRPTAALGLLTGLAGLLTVVPAFGEVAGAGFGLGAIAWFLAVGAGLTIGAVSQPVA